MCEEAQGAAVTSTAASAGTGMVANGCEVHPSERPYGAARMEAD
jgi:hypothetical protein